MPSKSLLTVPESQDVSFPLDLILCMITKKKICLIFEKIVDPDFFTWNLFGLK